MWSEKSRIKHRQKKNKNKIVEYFPWWLVHEIRSPFRSIRDGDVFHHFLGYISLTTNQIIYGVFLTNNRMVIWWMDGKRWIIIYYHDITLIFPWYCHDITIITMMVISDPTDGQICRLGGQGPLQIRIHHGSVARRSGPVISRGLGPKTIGKMEEMAMEKMEKPWKTII